MRGRPSCPTLELLSAHCGVRASYRGFTRPPVQGTALMGSLSYLKTLLELLSTALLTVWQDDERWGFKGDFVYSLAPELHRTDCPRQWAREAYLVRISPSSGHTWGLQPALSCRLPQMTALLPFPV